MREPPAIVHVVSARSVIGGAERVMLALVKEGARRGLRQLVLNPFAIDSTGGAVGQAVTVAEFRALPCASAAGLPRLRRRLAQHLQEFRPNIVHAHMFHASVAVAAVRRRAEARVLSHQWGALLQQGGRHLEARLDRWAGRRYDVVVACSEDVRQHLARSRVRPGERLRVIHNGWQGDPLPSARRPGGPSVVCVANFRPEKGHAVLLDAWARVARSWPSAKLVLVGDGPLADSLHARVSGSKLHDTVEFTGPVDNVWEVLASADLFVLPSLHEPFGIVAAEAMAAGLAVIASGVGGLPEFVIDGTTGLLVPPGDPAALAQAIGRLLADSGLRESMGAAGRQHAGTLHMDVTVARYFALYDELRARGPM